MAQESINIACSIGRLVRGSLTERAKEDYDGNPIEEGKGAFEIGYAIPKNDPLIGDILGKIYQQAASGYANNQGILQKIGLEWQSGFTAGVFRFKIRDGDQPSKTKGQINQNTVGHWVFNLSSYIPFKVTYTTRYGLPVMKTAMGADIPPERAEIDPALVNIGDYAHIAIGVKVNDKLDHTAGVYLNVNGIMLAARGERITGGISLEDAFAGFQTSALPAGANVSAVAGPGLPAQTAPAGNSAPAAAVGGLPGPGAVPAATGGPGIASPSNVAPHTAFVAGPGAAAGGPGVGMPGLPGQ